ncbi:uncharacterized protein BO95DRAFT_71988 [Aspergillus brunneoviolaceus CBS 621.78]|uniref:Uncharacterized protein n=1 Tax=Aspergillus brunneoviolaceus CBS 621.78 TaxID=1450534 RepID=A0ACD1GFD0_9EURO|nr:hypothetical protein BO95DRAFT_71988 [Aspergillus brunneoviolaceus CBS 621.78]RAH47887.1 hypothetical protein BO95DRAFT_71988 [Aspergillus brunneoviolaceus CBS 621.78]
MIPEIRYVISLRINFANDNAIDDPHRLQIHIARVYIAWILPILVGRLSCSRLGEYDCVRIQTAASATFLEPRRVPADGISNGSVLYRPGKPSRLLYPSTCLPSTQHPRRERYDSHKPSRVSQSRSRDKRPNHFSSSNRIRENLSVRTSSSHCTVRSAHRASGHRWESPV